MVDLDFKFFFDRQYVADKIDAGTRKALSKAGAFVRTSARSSIRTRKRASQPGEAPRNVTGLLKDRLFFFYDEASKSVVIGPQLVPGTKRKGTQPTPELLEFGGTTTHWRTGKPAVYRAFPFMKPAFDKNVSKFPEFFSNMLGS